MKCEFSGIHKRGEMNRLEAKWEELKEARSRELEANQSGVWSDALE